MRAQVNMVAKDVGESQETLDAKDIKTLRDLCKTAENPEHADYNLTIKKVRYLAKQGRSDTLKAAIEKAEKEDLGHWNEQVRLKVVSLSTSS